MSEEEIKSPDQQVAPADNANSKEGIAPVEPMDVGKGLWKYFSWSPKKKRKRKPLSCFEIWTVVLWGIAILVAAGTGVAIYWQDRIASATLGELQKQYPQLQKSADAAKNAADTAEKSFRADERPYVTVYSIESKTGPLKVGENSIDFSVLNSGKTPALSVQDTMHVIVGGKTIAEFSPNGKSEGVVAGTRVSTNNYTLRLSLEDATNVARLQVRGSVGYIDVFGDMQYQTTFCAWYDPQRSQFKFCPFGNAVK